jgi:Protein of unknown function (DUF2934)
MRTEGMHMSPVSEEEVRKKARELWEAAGRPEGKDEEFRLEAERQLKEAMAQHELKTPDTL